MARLLAALLMLVVIVLPILLVVLGSIIMFGAIIEEWPRTPTCPAARAQLTSARATWTSQDHGPMPSPDRQLAESQLWLAMSLVERDC